MAQAGAILAIVPSKVVVHAEISVRHCMMIRKMTAF